MCKLMERNKINKYFEVNIKSGEGIENLIRNIELDILPFQKESEIIKKIN